MTHFRIHYEVRGGHTHLAIFAGKEANFTHGKCGDLCMTNKEFDDFESIVHVVNQSTVAELSEIELVEEKR